MPTKKKLPTFPSKQPRRHLDFVLHSKEILVKNFRIPDVSFSDHLPVMVDFDVRVKENHRSEQRAPHCYCRVNSCQTASTAA
jgi:hypothetical protein